MDDGSRYILFCSDLCWLIWLADLAQKVFTVQRLPSTDWQLVLRECYDTVLVMQVIVLLYARVAAWQVYAHQRHCNQQSPCRNSTTSGMHRQHRHLNGNRTLSSLWTLLTCWPWAERPRILCWKKKMPEENVERPTMSQYWHYLTSSEARFFNLDQTAQWAAEAWQICMRTSVRRSIASYASNIRLSWKIAAETWRPDRDCHITSHVRSVSAPRLCRQGSLYLEDNVVTAICSSVGHQQVLYEFGYCRWSMTTNQGLAADLPKTFRF